MHLEARNAGVHMSVQGRTTVPKTRSTGHVNDDNFIKMNVFSSSTFLPCSEKKNGPQEESEPIRQLVGGLGVQKLLLNRLPLLLPHRAILVNEEVKMFPGKPGVALKVLEMV